MSEMNKLKIKVVIDAEQYAGDQLLSNWEYSEDVDYPFIENDGANWLTLALRNAVQQAISDVMEQIVPKDPPLTGMTGAS